jgi:carbon-monoxide dehydrogenase medium subunit
VAEGVELLARHREEVAVLAGGTDLLIWNHVSKKKLPPYLLSLSGLKELDYLKYIPGEGLRIGAKTKVARLLSDPNIQARFPALYQAASTFATPQIRNMVTVLGNILRASPAGDCSCACLALGGEVVLRGKEGERKVSLDNFWLSYGVTARKSDEIAVELRVPELLPTTRSSFYRLTRVHEDLAKLNVAVRLEMREQTCTKARIAMGCVGPTPLRLKRTEGLLEGKTLSADLFRELDACVQGEVTPIDDQRSTAEYRRQVSGVILRRAIESAVGNG